MHALTENYNKRRQVMDEMDEADMDNESKAK